MCIRLSWLPESEYFLFYKKKNEVWFIHEHLNLFLLRTQAEMGHTCRGTINLATANIAVEDSCNFVISNGGAQTYHLKANSEVERQRWITALELAKAKAVHMQAESGKREKKQLRVCRLICRIINMSCESHSLFVFVNFFSSVLFIR